MGRSLHLAIYVIVYAVSLTAVGVPWWKASFLAVLVALLAATGRVHRYIALGGFVLIVIAIGKSMGVIPYLLEIYNQVLLAAA